MQESGDLPKPSRNAPARFKKRAGTLHAVRAIYALTANALKADGVELPELPEALDADGLISHCCAALRLYGRARAGDEPVAVAA